MISGVRPKLMLLRGQPIGSSLTDELGANE
jgi:hypothetical protein